MFFFFSTLAINIVMLNVIIAIVNDAYEDINERKDAANRYEQASMICENGILIGKK